MVELEIVSHYLDKGVNFATASCLRVLLSFSTAKHNHKIRLQKLALLFSMFFSMFFTILSIYDRAGIIWRLPINFMAARMICIIIY